MFFPIDPEEWSKALGQIRRLRYGRNWKRIGSSDIYWSAAFFAALVETVDSLLLEQPEQAFDLSSQGILLAERIRAESCPGGSEVGKRSLLAWAHAVHGSSCRAGERFPEAEAAFQQALWLAGSKAVLPWAAAEVDRRYAVLLLRRGSLAGLDRVNRSLEGYGDHAIGRANALLLRAVFHQQLLRDPASAALDLGLALELIEPKSSACEARMWVAGLHNLNYIYAVSCSDLATLDLTLRRVRALQKGLSKNEGYRRALCVWTEALLLAPLGATRGSKRLLNRARGWLFKHRYIHAGILCSVDLAVLHLRDDERSMALSTVEELGKQLAAAGAATAVYLEFWLKHRLPEELIEERLMAYRAAIVPIGFRGPGIFQPFTTIIGSNSVSSPSV